MAANFWSSAQARLLFAKQTLCEMQMEDRLRGLTDFNIDVIRMYFTQKIFELAKQCKLRQRVAASAVIYFRRFYLHNSFCRVDPRITFVGCVYLASKAEESLIGAKHMVAYAKKMIPSWPFDIKHVLDIEMVILEGLDFNLIVFSPYKSLAALLDDAKLHSLAQTAWSLLNDSYYTDVNLMYPPHLVALACVQLAANLLKTEISNWLASLDANLNEVADIVTEMLKMYQKQQKVPLACFQDDCNHLLDQMASKQ